MERMGGTLIREAEERSIKERKVKGKTTLRTFEKARRSNTALNLCKNTYNI